MVFFYFILNFFHVFHFYTVVVGRSAMIFIYVTDGLASQELELCENFLSGHFW